MLEQTKKECELSVIIQVTTDSKHGSKEVILFLNTSYILTVKGPTETDTIMLGMQMDGNVKGGSNACQGTMRGARAATIVNGRFSGVGWRLQQGRAFFT